MPSPETRTVAVGGGAGRLPFTRAPGIHAASVLASQVSFGTGACKRATHTLNRPAAIGPAAVAKYGKRRFGGEPNSLDCSQFGEKISQSVNRTSP